MTDNLFDLIKDDHDKLKASNEVDKPNKEADDPATKLPEEILVEDDKEEEKPDEPSLEDRARLQGWRPKREYRGNPDLWVEAKEFLYRGSYLKRINQLEKMVDTATQVAIKAEKRAYEQALRDLETERKTAKTIGDYDALEATFRKEQEIKKEFTPTVTSPSATASRRSPEEIRNSVPFKQFEVTDPWVLGKTKEARALIKAAEQISNEWKFENPSSTDEEELSFIHDEIRRQFPGHTLLSPTVEEPRNSPSKVSNMSTTKPSGAKHSQVYGKDYEAVCAKLEQSGQAAIAMVVKHMGGRGQDWQTFLSESQKTNRK